MTTSNKRTYRAGLLLLTLLLLLAASCTEQAGQDDGSGAPYGLRVDINSLVSAGNPAQRIAYSGALGEHSEFETGDFFGLFVIDGNGTVQATNMKVYCTGLDNSGQTVWAIYKAGDPQNGTSSNYPLSEILGRGSTYFAYYPYDESLNTATGTDDLKDYVARFADGLSAADQSSSMTACDLLVASNLPDLAYGEVHLQDRHVRLTFAHAFAMLRFHLPESSARYEYKFNGQDFTPCLLATDGGRDEYRYIFKPGAALDFCIKYLYQGKLYKFETGIWKVLAPIYTQAGHCYNLGDSEINVPYEAAVDMGTSVMWASFNLGAEKEYVESSPQDLSTLKGTCVMWAANNDVGDYGKTAYTTYNKNFTLGTKPSELPAGYCFPGDPIYDAATNYWGGKWRIPTIEEWQELFDNCTRSVSNNIITFTSKTTGNSIKLKFAGYYDSKNATATTIGYYWSSSSNPTDVARAYSTNMTSSSVTIHSTASRYTGLPVRPVYSR